MPLPATSTTAVTRAIVLGTLATLIVVGTLSVLIYRSTLSGAVAQHSAQQLAMVRTAAIGVQGEIRGLSALLRQFSSLPSVQNLDVAFLGQRIEAAFGENPNGIVRYVGRLGADGRLFYWTPKGELVASGVPISLDPVGWGRTSDPASRGQVRMGTAWWLPDAPQTLQVLFTPVWRTSPSSENPIPANDFNGTVGLVIDLSRLVEVYLGPAITELADDQLVVGLATADFGVRLGPAGQDVSAASGDSHGHVDAQGTSILEEEDERLIHAWSQLHAADQSWLVASSSHYDRVAARVQRSATGQLALMTVLLVGVPLGGGLLYRRERNTQEGQRQLERQLAESQKMEAIGKLAGGVAHDFNNMLTAILGYSTMLYEDAAASSPTREHAGQIRKAAESAAALTQKLLAFSRRQVLHTNQFDFVAMLDGLLLLVRRVIGEGITVRSDPEPGLWPVLADPSQVEQSIVNLAINARDAMPDGGTLRIVARNAPRPDGERRPDGEVRPGNYVQIVVSDNGTGMDAATRERMFEPFFTTKPHGKGTGLGLSTVYGFIRQCGGYIFVTSTPGLGTSIELLLPRAPDMPAAVPMPEPTPTPIGAVADGTMETILVAEDQDEVRRLFVQTLRRAGYTVIDAGSGDEALRAAEGFGGDIHLLLSDVVMPGMKGPELAARLRAVRPSIHVVLMSGYAGDVVTKDDLNEATLLSKPFPPSLLAETVRQVLDQPLSRGPRPKG